MFRGDGKIYEAWPLRCSMCPHPASDTIAAEEKGKYQSWRSAIRAARWPLSRWVAKVHASVRRRQIAGGDALIAASKKHLQDIVDGWRNASPMIVKLWGDIENTFREVLEDGKMRPHETRRTRRQKGK